jgi:hypothetical protein
LKALAVRNRPAQLRTVGRAELIRFSQQLVEYSPTDGVHTAMRQAKSQPLEPLTIAFSQRNETAQQRSGFFLHAHVRLRAPHAAPCDV